MGDRSFGFSCSHADCLLPLTCSPDTGGSPARFRFGSPATGPVRPDSWLALGSELILHCAGSPPDPVARSRPDERHPVPCSRCTPHLQPSRLLPSHRLAL